MLNYNQLMRAILILLLSTAFLVGCKNTRPSDSATGPEGSTAVKPKRSTKTANKPAVNREPTPQATAINEAAGKVASVNPGLRFVVIDFSLNPVPQVDQRLSLYRQGQKVGEVKISAQSRNSIVAADLTAGEAQVGDEVRAE